MHRIAGTDRYQTAVKVSQQSFSTPQPMVFIASGENYPDALAAGPAAAWTGSPVLLVKRDTVPTVVQNELARLKPKQILVIGGDSAVSQTALNTVAKYAPGGATHRIAGTNRYGTAEAVAQGWETGAIKVVYLASGETFADALGGGAAASYEEGALLLTAKGKLPTETKRALQHLKPTKIVILGSTAAVTGTVASQVKAATGITPLRYGGADRYKTAALVAEKVWKPAETGSVFLASGTNFPDALSATPSAAINGAPILLTKATCTPMATATAVTNLEPDLVVFLGSKSVTHEGDKIC
jgi:putative cell wall-binding protein